MIELKAFSVFGRSEWFKQYGVDLQDTKDDYEITFQYISQELWSLQGKKLKVLVEFS